MTTTTYRIAVGGIAHETHSFATRPTGLEDFRKQALFFGDDILAQLAGGKSATAGMIDNADEDWQLLPTVYAGAMPGGVVTTEAFETIVGELTAGWPQAMPLDGVLLALHGAMVTDGRVGRGERHPAGRARRGRQRDAHRDHAGHARQHLAAHGRACRCAHRLRRKPAHRSVRAGREAADVMGRLLSGEIQPDRGLRASAADSGAPGDRHRRSAAGPPSMPVHRRWRPRMP